MIPIKPRKYIVYIHYMPRRRKYADDCMPIRWRLTHRPIDCNNNIESYENENEDIKHMTNTYAHSNTTKRKYETTDHQPEYHTIERTIHSYYGFFLIIRYMWLYIIIFYHHYYHYLLYICFTLEKYNFAFIVMPIQRILPFCDEHRSKIVQSALRFQWGRILALKLFSKSKICAFSDRKLQGLHKA